MSFRKSIVPLILAFSFVCSIPGFSVAMGVTPDAAPPQKAPAAASEETAQPGVAPSVGSSLKGVSDSMLNANGGLSIAPAGTGSLGNELPALEGKAPAQPMSPVGGLGSKSGLPGVGGSMGPDGFPPFFGDGGNSPAAQPQPNAAPADQALLGRWGARDASGQSVDMLFQPGGICVIVTNGQQINGTYAVQGSQLTLFFPNGQSATLSFRIEGDTLVLSDGSRLQRQGGAQPQVAQPQPVPSPIPSTVPQTPGISNQSLEGAWAANNGQTMLIMMFMNGMCGLNVNGRQFYGPYTVQGNRLRVQFANAKPLDTVFSIQGNTLRLGDGTTLVRQQVNGAPGLQPQPTATQPMPQTGGASPLEGAWSARLQNGAVMTFVFSGSQYRVLANGQQTEAGTFALNGNRLEYVVTSGPSAGQRGVNTWQINNNVLTITMPNGASAQFQRQQ